MVVVVVALAVCIHVAVIVVAIVSICLLVFARYAASTEDRVDCCDVLVVSK